MAAGAQQQRHAAGECGLSLGLKGFLSILVSASRLNVSTRTQGQNSGIDSALSANFVGHLLVHLSQEARNFSWLCS